MPIQSFRLDMMSPLHVGEMGVGQEETLDYIPSDTLFSALVMTWLELPEYRTLIDDLAHWSSRGPALLLTSAFPYLGEVHLFPRPHLPVQPQNGGKSYKRIRWVTESIFQSLVTEPTTKKIQHLWDDRAKEGPESIWRSTQDPLPTEAIWGRMRVPKVAVDRESNASNLFHVGRFHFGEEAGLWFSADGDSTWLSAVDVALHHLADVGVGGQRSRGNGRFRLADAPISSPMLVREQGQTAYQVLLSRLAPKSSQMDLLRRPSSSYQLVTVGGWSAGPGDRPLIRCRLRMLTEGSLIENSPHPPGKLVDVNPAHHLVSHPIYRYGYGYGVPVHLPQDWLDDVQSTGVAPKETTAP